MCNHIEHLEAHIMPCMLIFTSRIAQPAIRYMIIYLPSGLNFKGFPKQQILTNRKTAQHCCAIYLFFFFIFTLCNDFRFNDFFSFFIFCGSLSSTTFGASIVTITRQVHQYSILSPSDISNSQCVSYVEL